MLAASDPRAVLPSPAHGSHVVQFYEEEDFIVDAVADFLNTALLQGGSAILIATPEHRAALQQRLVAGGGGQRTAGALVALDARDTLARFMVGGMPDEARFMASVGHLVMQAARRTAGDIRAYGEMVALLCEDGNVPAAIALEGLWNGLAARQTFALMCGYPLRLFAASDREEAFHQVCAAHARVRPAETRADEPGPARDLEIAALQQKAAALEDEIRRRTEAEVALRQSERALQDFLESAPQCIHRVGPDGTLLWANAAELSLLGYEARDYIGRNIADFHVDPACVAGILRRVAAGQSVHDERASLRCRDGSHRIVEISSNGFFEEGRFRYTRCFTRDVTELVHSRQVLEAADRERSALLAELEAANRAKDEFLAMLGHELRNPLSPIVSALQLMRQRGDAHSSHEQAIIQRQVAHLIRLVDDLLDVARITRGTVELRRETVPLSQVLARSVEMASLLVEQRQHLLTMDVPATDMHWSGDPMRLAQVVSNLLTNAARYTEPGGRLDLAAREEDGWFVISVRDNGKGIEADVLPRVFDLFFQGRQAIDRPQGGLGIGLALVRNLVELHGGTVEAHSAGPGQGSEFIVRLPALGAPGVAAGDGGPDQQAANADDVRPPTSVTSATGESEVSDAPQASRSGPRILVVDDNEDAAETIAMLLEAGGYRVAVANDPLAALALAASFEPELALLDLGLPVMDGYQLAGRLRQERPAALRLLALTGYGQAGDRERTRAAGFDAHLVKPVDADELLALVHALLNGTAAAGQEAA